jgi:hypothetical protein
MPGTGAHADEGGEAPCFAHLLEEDDAPIADGDGPERGGKVNAGRRAPETPGATGDQRPAGVRVAP